VSLPTRLCSTSFCPWVRTSKCVDTGAVGVVTAWPLCLKKKTYCRWTKEWYKRRPQQTKTLATDLTSSEPNYYKNLLRCDGPSSDELLETALNDSKKPSLPFGIHPPPDATWPLWIFLKILNVLFGHVRCWTDSNGMYKVCCAISTTDYCIRDCAKNQTSFADMIHWATIQY